MSGRLWHAIMHRREPDASNARYWFRRIGSHPVVDRLAVEAVKLGHPDCGPIAFVDMCERVRGTGSGDELLARRIQRLEWQLLFDWCVQKSLASGST